MEPGERKKSNLYDDWIIRPAIVYEKIIKRFFDILFSGCLIVILSPLLCIVGIVVFLFLGRPILFFQQRVTRNERLFKIIKFRTMNLEYDKDGNKLTLKERENTVGNILRSMSVDELPELFNIFKGDLSFVGPRPLFEEYLPYYSDEEKKRHNVRGGLIPPDCFSNKVSVSWDEQLMWEAWYADNVSLRCDVKVIMKTINIVLKRMRFHYGEERRKSLMEERNSKYEG